jgi:predicted DNA-binding protein with PD1-like motif
VFVVAETYQAGRCFIERLPHGKDLITSIESFCRDQGVNLGTFSLIGAVTSVTLGAYDQRQQVYVSDQQTAPLEILSCSGNISLKGGVPFVHAHAVLGKEDGSTLGGHLFSDTLIFAGEIYIQEWLGPPLVRQHDNETGLMLWDKGPFGVKSV